MADLVDRHAITRLLPGHGPVVRDPDDRIRYYRDHRLKRLEQVRRAYDEGKTSVALILERVYGDIVGDVRRAAELTIRAQLEYLGLPVSSPKGIRF